jgi:methionyl-tRNA formyltransferase
MKIIILVDNINSWALPYAKKLVNRLKQHYSISLVHDQNKIRRGDVAIFLSCEKIVNADILKRNKHNLVAHASDLPAGKGWSPLTWQILKGKNKISVTLFEAVEKIDAGVIYDQVVVPFGGYELIDDMHRMIGEIINSMIINFLKAYPNVKGVRQSGRESFYRRRRPEDSKLDPNKTISEQFNLLRVVDNKRYPAFFEYRRHRYILEIYKHE